MAKTEREIAGQGLKIKRFFTKPGVHPYDEVEWEIRDAVIPNFKQGGNAFEQRAVEFPATWSQNATNIVAQKYFRGPLGTPQRERSVRQLIDRVADTITAWGWKDGYFAAEEDRDAFNHELKKILVTQSASFNSPVWFNVGVEATPQASACFILAVEDTMSSILNWYVEEGTIFKGGSGSGINLSTIRSSREKLSAGGEASGPVSFMRGADASAGTIKCLHADTPLVTGDGLRPIGELRRGDHVLTRRGFRAVEAVHDNGVRALVRVMTALGDEILCTPEHRFRVRSSGGELWREAGDLLPDDYLLIDLGATEGGSLQPLAPVEAGHHNEITHELPTVVDEPFALWLGWVFGDGSITSRASAKFVAVQVGDSDPELAERYVTLTRTIFGPTAHVYVNRRLKRRDASVSVRIASSQLVRFLDVNGLRKQAAHELRVPPLIASSPASVRAAFLAGLFEADGHVGNGYPWLSTVSWEFARDIHRLLLSLGIPSKLSRIDDRRAALGSRPVHTVRVVGGEGVRRFSKLVGFVSERKSYSLEAAVERKDGSPHETQWFLPHVAQELGQVWESTRDQQVRRALAPYTRYTRARRMSLLRARKLVERFPDELGSTSLSSFAEGNALFVQAAIEPSGEGPTFDLTVEDVHEYLVHNVVTHNSGGKTRRAAKMVVLNVDHPDVEEFIWCKAIEERKARVLRDAGFDMDLDGRDSHSTQYQNANNSVRVTDDFMMAYIEDRDWALKAVTRGDVLKVVRAHDLMRQVGQAAWECADPGMQYDTTTNAWHTCPNSGRINASNPCFTGDARVHTDRGLVRFDDLMRRVIDGESFEVYTHDITNPDAPRRSVRLSKPTQFMVTGINEIVRLRFSDGREIRCTPNHGIWTTNRGWVRADQLTGEDEIPVLDQPTPPAMADYRLPVPRNWQAYAVKGDWSLELNLPEKWDEDLAHYLGWLIGDGCISGNTVTTVYGSKEDREEVLPLHIALLTRLNGGREPKPSVQPNGTVQLRLSRRPLTRFFEALGVKAGRAATKEVPWSIFEGPQAIQRAFLRGLFDADGCAVALTNGTRYVGLGSKSSDLLRGVQILLGLEAIASRIYDVTGTSSKRSFSYKRKDGTEVTYESRGKSYDLRVVGKSKLRFFETIGFGLSRKRSALAGMLEKHATYNKQHGTTLAERTFDGFELTYNLTEPINHSYVVNSVLVRNCSEYLHLDNSACNLASLNLMKFLNDDDSFDIQAFRHAIDIVFLAQEIIVGNSSYPTAKIERNAKDFRQLGLGFANLGALLMARGIPYDSDAGRAWAGAITALMTGWAYRASAKFAEKIGPFAGFAANRDPMLGVMRKHRAAADQIDPELVPEGLLQSAKNAWDDAITLGEKFGYRNSQASVIAPTGTIGLMMDCDTTGVEPDLALVKTKKLVGGGTMKIVNQTVPRALKRLGYAPDEVEQIVSYIHEHNTPEGAPHLREEHYAVFDCAMGDRSIHYMGHVKMMAAVQPGISGAISKTVNMPESVTVEEVENLFVEGWRLGLKALAIYRDNCKVAQPLSADKKKVKAAEPAVIATGQPQRRRLPKSRPSTTTSFRVGDQEGYVTAGSYPDNGLGEIFIKAAKQGSTLSGVMDALAISVSMGLQYGVPLDVYVSKFMNMQFPPSGMTDDPDVRFATSLVDYISRRLAIDYLDDEARARLGIRTTEERREAVNGGNGKELPQVAVEPEPESAARQDTEAIRFLDAPYCYNCGNRMRPSGSCFVCEACGSTSGCS